MIEEIMRLYNMLSIEQRKELLKMIKEDLGESD